MLFGTLDSAGVRNNRQTELDFQGEEPEYNSSRMIVTFPAVDGNKSVPCAVGREDLEDHFNGNQKDHSPCLGSLQTPLNTWRPEVSARRN